MSGANLEADLILCSVLSCAKKVAAKPWPAPQLAEAFEHREQNSDENNVRNGCMTVAFLNWVLESIVKADHLFV